MKQSYFSVFKSFNLQLERIIDLAKANHKKCLNRHEFVSPDNLYVNLDMVNKNFKILK